jgi:hypothetical protein
VYLTHTEIKMSDKKFQPRTVSTPSYSGYPCNVPTTQTMKIRGTGAATKGTKYNAKVF